MSEVNEQEANNETQDILHSLELQDHDYHDFARLSKELTRDGDGTERW